MQRLSKSAMSCVALRAAEYHSKLDGVTSFLSYRGISEASAIQFQLGYDGERLTIPYLTPAGVVQLKRRCIQMHDCKEAQHPKYLGEDGAGIRLFNAQTLLTATTVVCVEGELNAIAGETCGIPHVGRPGAQAWKANRNMWRHCFDNADEIIVVGDLDKPLPGKTVGVGEADARMVADDLRKHLPDAVVRVVILTPDPADFVRDFGPAEYLTQLGIG